MLEALLVFLLLAATLAVLLSRAEITPGRLTLLIAGCALLAAGRYATWRGQSLAAYHSVIGVRQEIPQQKAIDGYVSSQRCQSCHPSQYNSWHATYHRTMTQAASPISVRGDFNKVRLAHGGFDFVLERRGDEFWSKMSRRDENGVEHFAPDAQIVMSTGSHHYQVYWVSTDAASPAAASSNRALAEFPFAWLIGDRRWIPREAALIMPPHLKQTPVMWQGICIRCHSTHGEPRLDIEHGKADSRVAELGIACEACHGPGEAHVLANQNPLRRYQQHLSGSADSTIVQPERLSAERSSQVCGQCHAISTYPSRDWWQGQWNRFRPGHDLLAVQNIVRPKRPATLAHLQDVLAQDPEFLRGRFWSDGMVRVSGREYNGLIESKCFEGGEFSCLSCHSMHDSPPDDQLKSGMQGDQACLQCHAEHGENIPAHTHHAADSQGSRCYNCHMPHTTYGLLKAIRSHQVDSPDVAASIKTGRPTACNQCHVDKTLAWTQHHLHEWYAAAEVPLAEEHGQVSATLYWLLTGDAGQRALAAWTLGWEAARGASGQDWMAPYLGHLLDDPYPAVRYIAERSLRRLPGYEHLQYDFVGPADARQIAQHQVQRIWDERALPAASLRPELLIGADGKINLARFQMLARQRDDRDLDLQE